MGGSHSHREIDHDVTGATARWALLSVTVLLAVATAAGTFWLWPEQDRTGSVDYYGPGVTQHAATVVGVSETCPVVFSDEQRQSGEEFPEDCNEITAEVEGGPDRGTEIVVEATPASTKSGLVVGDRIQVARIPSPDDSGTIVYGYVGIERGSHLVWFTGLFFVVVVAVARLRGLLAVVGLVFAGLVLWKFMLPALLDGSPGWMVAICGSSLIMYVVLYLAHGLSVRTTVALLGTLLGVGVTAVVGLWGIDGASVSGFGSESGEALYSRASDLNFQDLVLCAVIIAGLGVLNDVTITQASAVYELRAAGPHLSRRRLFRSGMRIGRDHIASTIYTIAFAYAGTSLTLLTLVSLFDRPLLDLLLDEGIAEEVVRTMASGVGLVLAVPITTVLAVFSVSSPAEPDTLFASEDDWHESPSGRPSASVDPRPVNQPLG
ncbi:MAG: YibE/F family protein [Nocardioides sp.]